MLASILSKMKHVTLKVSFESTSVLQRNAILFNIAKSKTAF